MSFLISRKRTVNFRNQRLWRHLAADDTIIISRALKVTGSHAMYDRSVMSSSRALCCLLSVKKQKHDFHFFFVQCIIKQLLDSVFVVSRIVKAEVGVISLDLWLRLITPTSTLIILDITKTSSSNCLLPKARGNDGQTASEKSSFWTVHLQGVLGKLHLLPGARCVWR